MKRKLKKQITRLLHTDETIRDMESVKEHFDDLDTKYRNLDMRLTAVENMPWPKVTKADPRPKHKRRKK